jgi:hypothetical protein
MKVYKSVLDAIANDAGDAANMRNREALMMKIGDHVASSPKGRRAGLVDHHQCQRHRTVSTYRCLIRWASPQARRTRGAQKHLIDLSWVAPLYAMHLYAPTSAGLHDEVAQNSADCSAQPIPIVPSATRLSVSEDLDNWETVTIGAKSFNLASALVPPSYNVGDYHSLAATPDGFTTMLAAHQ